MELVTAVVNPVVESLIGVVKRHLSFCFYSTNNIRDMRARIEQLNDTAHDMKTRKEMNDANNLVVPRHVPSWLAQVERICEEAENVPAGGIGCFNMKARYKAGKQSFDILRKIDDLETQKSNIEWSDEPLPLGRVLSTLPSTSEPVVVAAANDDDGTQTELKSRDLIFKEAMKSLDPNNKIQNIALCGMGGVGKTTMMDQLKKVAEDKKMFNWIVKVVIGKSENLIAIQQTVAEYIGQPLTETQKDTRAERLRKRFVGMSQDGKKNILVILDDLWEAVDLEDIGLTSPLPNGFKLLLTSRDERVCSQLGVETSRIFKIAVFEEPEAKKLFWEIAGTVSDGNIDHDLLKIGEEIVKKCGGLPIAIKTIASTLRDNNVKDVWFNALERLQNKEPPFVLETVFKTSYENLKDDDEKATFLLSGLFPDDYNIPIEDLMRYGWGLKLFQNSKKISTARRWVNTCVYNLVRSNLLIESDRKGCVKMHDLVRDFVLSNFSNVKQASLVNSDDISEQLIEESYERILLKCTGMREFPADFNHPNLSLLKILDGDKLRTFSKDFYDRMKKLEVVAYDGIRQPLLPQYSTTLRTLCLRSCRSMGDISFIGDLINLEVLSFAFCGISKLPSAIGNLKKLKLLDLTDCVDLCIDDGVFLKLEKLRELYMRALEGKPIRFTEDSCEGLKMLASKLIALDVEFFESIIQPKNLSFEKLERFQISMGCQFENSDKDVYAYENTLKLVVSCKELLECKINDLYEKAEKLDLSVNDMSSLEQISMYPSQHSFCNLRVLYVYECADLTSLFTVNVASSLTKLESLTVSKCPVLESLVQGENSEAKVIKFHKLKELRLEKLPMFVSLCDTDQVMELPQVVELTLEGLPNITSIFSRNNEISATTQPLLNKKIVIPNLEELYIQRMEKLKEIWSCENTSISENSEAKVIKFHKLKVLRLEYLPMFVSLCDTDQVMELPQVVVLALYGLPNNTSIFFEKNEISATTQPLLNKKIVIPNLEMLSIWGMEKLKEIWWCENTSISEEDVNNIFMLRDIHVYECPSLVNLFPCNPMRLLSHLTVINGQKQQPRSLFHNLTSIRAYRCKSIKYLFSPLMATHLSNLKEIMIIGCDGMEEVVSNRDDNEDEHMTAPTTTTLFPHLDLLYLYPLPSLKHVGGGVVKGTNNDIKHQLKYSQVPVVRWSLCQYSRKINVFDCPTMSHVIPSYVAGQLLMVEDLSIYDCITMKEVFATTDINNSGGLSSNFEERSGGTDTALAIPRVTRITAHKLSNLKTMDIRNCNSLEHIFTFSTLESLTKLEEISIRRCKEMKVIAREENGEQTVASKAVVFPRLKSIRLACLPNLEGFFLGMSEFKWPLLDDVKIIRCPKMMAFTTSKSIAPKLKYIHITCGTYSPECRNFYVTTNSTQTPSLSLENGPLSLHDTIEVNVEDNDVIEEIFASNELLQLQNLEKINVKRCPWVRTVFEVESEVTDSELNSKSQTVVKFPKLREVDLEELGGLDYIWKSNIQGMKLEFPNLTRLSIHKCCLVYVFTSSMVGSLMKLQDLHITNCYDMEVIVKEEEDEENREEEVIIMLPCLKSLTLEHLPRLKGFYIGKELDVSLPSLNTLVIKECPKLEIFTKGRVAVPELKVIETNLGLTDVGEQDINSFIITKSQEGLHFAKEESSD